MSVRQRTKQRKSLNLSDDTKWIPHKYQLSAVARGFRQNKLAYFLDPGLGKTTIILQLYKMLKQYGKAKGILLIAPIRVMELVWPLEIQKWPNFRHLKINIMHGPKKKLDYDADINIINPAGLPWLKTQLHNVRVKKWPFDMMVVDESTMFKNYDSARFMLLQNYFTKKMSRRYILTGTPIPNGYMQLFSQFKIIDEGRSLGKNITDFRYHHFKPVGPPQYRQFKLRDGADKKINKKIARYVCRMSAEEYLKLPPISINTIKVDMPKKAMKQYEKLRDEQFLQVGIKEVYPPTAASLGQKLHQIANGNLYENWDVLEKGQVPPASKRPYFKFHNAKIEALKELQTELQGKPLFVGYWYHHDLITLQAAFPKAVVINSKTTSKQAAKIERDWNAGKIPLLLAQPASVAHGLNFQKAGGDVAWYSLVYDFELYDQFIKRLWRQGAIDKVMVHFLMTRGTIDEAIFEKLMGKKVVQDDFYEVMRVYQHQLKEEWQDEQSNRAA